MKSFFAVFALGLLCSTLSVAHGCKHDTLDFEPIVLQQTDVDVEIEAVGFAEERVRNYQPIRIMPEYSGIEHLPANQKHFLKSYLIPTALDKLSRLLTIERERDTISFNERFCFDVQVPSALIDQPIDTDLVMFVVAEETDPGTLASAAACFLHPSTKRPIGGAVWFNSLNIKTDPSTWNNQLHTVMHEMLHIMGFSKKLFPHFHTEKPAVEVAFKRGVMTKILATPKLIEVAKVYFNCSNIDGVELENEGGPGSQGSHFERRILGDETMTASDIPDPKLSIFTLAVLEDSGWYKPNYTEAQQLYFGRGRGCDFLEKSCIDEVTKLPRFPEFCSVNEKKHCTSDHTAVGTCVVEPRKNLSDAFNYFGNNTGGWDEYADGCPTVLDYVGTRCTNVKSFSFGHVGEESRCFNIKDSYQIYEHMCLKHKCSYYVDGSAELTFMNDEEEFVCPQKGGSLLFTRNTYQKIAVECPPAEEVCLDGFRMNSVYNENTGGYEYVLQTVYEFYGYVKGWFYE